MVKFGGSVDILMVFLRDIFRGIKPPKQQQDHQVVHLLFPSIYSPPVQKHHQGWLLFIDFQGREKNLSGGEESKGEQDIAEFVINNE